MSSAEENIFSIIKFDENGLIPAVIQDCETKEVLMMAWMNEESLRLTIDKKVTYFFSRSRQKLWQKGEESGQIQEVKEISIDCDGDCLVIKVKQKGVACHTGTKSCFFRDISKNGNLKINQEVITPTNELYGKDK